MDGRDSGFFMDDQEARIIFHRQQDFIEICEQSGFKFQGIHSSLDPV